MEHEEKEEENITCFMHSEFLSSSHISHMSPFWSSLMVEEGQFGSLGTSNIMLSSSTISESPAAQVLLG